VSRRGPPAIARRADSRQAWSAPTTGDPAMAKGLQQKKETKKKPTKTLKEKRAEKAAKKGG
jgi:hypothetical protein